MGNGVCPQMRDEKRVVLLADDERVIRQLLAAVLTDAGYDVVAVKNGQEAIDSFRARRPDLVLLDVMMPKMDGYAACQRIRETDAETPILFLTALDSDSAQIRGLGIGADDYIAKTAPTEVLLARLASALRRVRPFAPSGDFDFGPWRVWASRLEMTNAADGACVSLSEREVAVLRLFATHPGEVFSRDYLVSCFWEAAEVSDNALSACIYALREKLGAFGTRIESIRGAGYLLR